MSFGGEIKIFKIDKIEKKNSLNVSVEKWISKVGTLYYDDSLDLLFVGGSKFDKIENISNSVVSIFDFKEKRINHCNSICFNSTKMKKNFDMTVIIKISLSPDREMLCTLDLSGNISVLSLTQQQNLKTFPVSSLLGKEIKG